MSVFKGLHRWTYHYLKTYYLQPHFNLNKQYSFLESKSLAGISEQSWKDTKKFGVHNSLFLSYILHKIILYYKKYPLCTIPFILFYIRYTLYRQEPFDEAPLVLTRNHFSLIYNIFSKHLLLRFCLLDSIYINSYNFTL